VTSSDETGEEQCSDGCDNDGDGLVDCNDKTGCNWQYRHIAACATSKEDTIEKCSDGWDNDGDGFTDCNDAGCWNMEMCK